MRYSVAKSAAAAPAVITEVQEMSDRRKIGMGYTLKTQKGYTIGYSNAKKYLYIFLSGELRE